MGIDLEFTGERAVPWHMPGERGPSLSHHIQRYAFASRWCVDAQVLDLGSGTGYGAFMLSWLAHSVRGVDKDQATLDAAIAAFPAPNLYFDLVDLDSAQPRELAPWSGTTPVPPVYVAFEVLEHLEDPVALVAKLPSAATLICSVPIADANQWHKHVYPTPEQAAKFLLGLGRGGGRIFWQDRQGLIAPAAAGVAGLPLYALAALLL